MSTPAFNLPSFAKINLSLQILGRRADGYHEIRTLLQTVSLQDQLRFTQNEATEVVLTCNDSTIPLGRKNLIVRAADALRQRFSVTTGARIHLEKLIPAQAGLGGASSNAAIALIGLARLWQLKLEPHEFMELGSRIGADVPFFFVGGRALATGIGTNVSAVDDEERKHIIIVTPIATVSTATAYAALKAPALTSPDDATILSISRAEADLELSRLCIPRNDFENVILESEPEIGRAKKALLHVGAISSLLAGSGSSVFGIFETQQEQERALREIKAEPGWRVFPAATVSRSEYLQALSLCGSPLSRSE